VRHNVVLPADAAPWLAVVRGELPPAGPEELSIVAAAGPAFFEAAARALDESGADFPSLVRILKERTGRKGAELFMPLRVALTGKTHGPELAPLLKIMPRDTARRRLQTHARNP
jgi:glutamyl/glutaminyl-tRNA synthetase